MFCVPRLILGSTEGVRSCFHILRSLTHFGWYQGAGSSFHIWRSQTHFWWYRGHQVYFLCFALPDPFSTASGPALCFALLDSFWVVPWAKGPVFMFYALGIVLGDIEGVSCSFHVLRSSTRFWLYRGHRVQFLGFVIPNSFSAVPRASGLVFMFCTLRLILGGTEGAGLSFHGLRSRNHFRRLRGRLDQFSFFLLPNSFSAVSRASGLVFKFCSTGLIFVDTEGVWVQFLCFALPDSFLAILRAPSMVFMFCTPELALRGAVGVGV
jgi:hypothetical protein